MSVVFNLTRGRLGTNPMVFKEKIIKALLMISND